MVDFRRDAFEIQREGIFNQLRSTGCGSGDRQTVDFLRIIDEKMNL